MSDGWSSPGVARVAEYCLQLTGLTSIERRVTETESAIRRAMSHMGLGSPEEYLLHIQEDPGLIDRLVDEIVVGETYFFREPETLDFLLHEALPAVSALRDPGHVLNLWSAGCATGEEPYTLAILLEKSEWRGRFRILATDISRSALARARIAEYSPWALRTTSPEMTRRYFEQIGLRRYAVAARYRKLVEFRYHNLASGSFPDLASGVSGIDVILCRNVLMYFPREVTGRIAGNFFQALAPGGWLLTGASDPPVGAEAPFETMVTGSGVFYRRPEAAGVPCTLCFNEANAAPDEEVFPDPFEIPPVEPEAVETPAPVDPAQHPGASPPVPTTMERARRLQQSGEIDQMLALLDRIPLTLESASLQVQTLASLGRSDEAEALARKTTSLFPDAPDARFLLAMLLAQRGSTRDALAELRRTLYLDPEAALAHFFHGLLLDRSGNQRMARRAFRNALELASALPPDVVLPGSEDQRAGSLAEAAAAQLSVLERTLEGRR